MTPSSSNVLSGMMKTALGAAFVTLSAVSVQAETLGVGRVFSNDFFGDRLDRWRTGAYSVSVVQGDEWQGRAPSDAFEVMEYRINAEIIAPSRLSGPGSDDRPYVSALSFGAHTHFAAGLYDVSFGAEVTAIGPQTGLSALQESFHELVDAPRPRAAEDQLENQIIFGGAAEVSRPLSFGRQTHVRPFAQVTVGREDIARVGVDVFYGGLGADDLLVRDTSTGHLYRAVDGSGGGLGMVAGLDMAYVNDSLWLPSDRGVTQEDMRLRARAGLHWQLAPQISGFYGVSYLSEEFEGQPEGQLLGSLKLNFNF